MRDDRRGVVSHGRNGLGRRNLLLPMRRLGMSMMRRGRMLNRRLDWLWSRVRGLLLGRVLLLLVLLLLLLDDLVRMHLVHHLFVRGLGHVLHRRTRLRRKRRMNGMDPVVRFVLLCMRGKGGMGTTHFSLPVTLQSPKLLA